LRGRFAKVQSSKRNSPPDNHELPDQEIIMNIAKNMEAIFVTVLALAGITSYATAAVPKFHAALHPAATRSVAVASAGTNAMPTVVIAAKRLTAEQKAAL
jgi:hypothetical protein